MNTYFFFFIKNMQNLVDIQKEILQMQGVNFQLISLLHYLIFLIIKRKSIASFYTFLVNFVLFFIIFLIVEKLQITRVN